MANDLQLQENGERGSAACSAESKWAPVVSTVSSTCTAASAMVADEERERGNAAAYALSRELLINSSESRS